MIEIFEDAKVETSEDTRKKAIAAFGFDEPPALEKLSRSDFGSDEEFYNAVAELSVRNNSPEYREAYRKIRRSTPRRKKLRRKRQQSKSTKRRLHRQSRAVCCVQRNSRKWTIRHERWPKMTLPPVEFPSRKWGRPWPGMRSS